MIEDQKKGLENFWKKYLIFYFQQIKSLNQEISVLRAKARRTEEDNIKKVGTLKLHGNWNCLQIVIYFIWGELTWLYFVSQEKEIEGLLDPTKNEEMRRTMGERHAESGAVIQSLKQKILKLENQIRDKEANYA